MTRIPSEHLKLYEELSNDAIKQFSILNKLLINPVARLKYLVSYRSNTVEQYFCLLTHGYQTALHINVSNYNW